MSVFKKCWDRTSSRQHHGHDYYSILVKAKLERNLSAHIRQSKTSRNLAAKSFECKKKSWIDRLGHCGWCFCNFVRSRPFDFCSISIFSVLSTHVWYVNRRRWFPLLRVRRSLWNFNHYSRLVTVYQRISILHTGAYKTALYLYALFCNATFSAHQTNVLVFYSSRIWIKFFHMKFVRK